MNKISMLGIIVALAACSPQPSPVTRPTTPQPADTPLPTSAGATAQATNLLTAAKPSPAQAKVVSSPAPTLVPISYAGLALPVERGQLFSTSGACAICHTNLTDESGADVSIDSAWRSGMMANSTHDPYWQASVRAEVISNPDYEAVIEDKCATCHMPMARFTAAADGGTGIILEDGFLNPENEMHTLAMDGVSCTLCHQIQKTGLGETGSFSGGYAIDTDLPAGERHTFGPYPVEDAQAAIMKGAAGFVPVQSEHIGRSELCATCHTLYTPYVDAEGQIAGKFPEQTPYQEWLHSSYQESHACQDCHMPTAQGGVQISITGGDPRSPFYQHTSAGGNVFILQVLRAFGEELGVTASSEQFETSIERAYDQLRNRTAAVTFDDVTLLGSQLTANLIIESQVAHKFPTGFPSRRAWLHLTVHDADGQLVFESGALGPEGSIVGNDNDADPATYEPHYMTIDRSDQVQVYETIMGDTEGDPTTTLL